MGRLLWCRLCTERYELLGGEAPGTCPSCGQAAHWSSIEVPKRQYMLSENDKRFLKSIRVDGTEEDDGA